MEQGELGLTDTQFWENLVDHEDRILDGFDEREFQGLVLDGPRQVRLSSGPDLPLVGVRASSIRDEALLSHYLRLVLVVSRLEGDEVRAGTAFRINEDARGRGRPRDGATFPEGRAVKLFGIAASERIDDLPWQAGTLQAHLLLYDQRSNGVTVSLVGNQVQDPVVREFLAAQKQPGYPRAVWPAVGALRSDGHPYRARPDSPPVPGRSGIALAVERVVVKRPRATCVVRGSFALPVRERDVVRPPPPPPGDGWVDVGDPAAKAVLPITLVLTGDTIADPILVHLHVPAYDAVAPGDLATGHFAVDLFGVVPDEALEAQTYAVWAISGAVLSSPALVGVVTPDMLPRPGEP